MTKEYYKNIFKEELTNETNISLLIKEFYVEINKVYKGFKSKKTFKLYLSNMNTFERYLFYCLNNRDIREVTREDLNNYKVFLKDKLELKETTVNSHLNTLRKFYDYLKSSNIVEYNLVKDINNYKTSINDLNIVKISEIKIIFNSIMNSNNELKHRDIIILRVLLETGSLITDILNIKMSDIYIDSKSIIINGNLFPISDKLIKDIKDYIIYREKYLKGNNNYLLINRNGNKYSERSFQLALKNYLISSDINRKITARNFRSTFLFNLARKVEKEKLILITNQKKVDRYYKELKENPLFNL